MTLEAFVADHQSRWTELESLIARARRRAPRLGPDGVRRLGELYRAAAADLALARRRYRGESIVERLDDLVRQARQLVYDSEKRTTSLLTFITTGYWQRIRERPALVVVSLLLLFGPWVLTAVWATRDPGTARGVVPAQYQRVTEPRHTTDLGLTPSEQGGMAGEIFTNNIRVTIVGFAAGITAGLGTALLLISQGIIFGGITGLSIWAGNARPFFELTLAHGLLELSCVVVASAAGLRLGWALVNPGLLRRSVALSREARAAVEILLGTAPWLVLAGLVEGFVTPRGVGLENALVIGVALAGLYWGLVFWRGRARIATPALAPSL